jgi:hypothetical protein
VSLRVLQKIFEKEKHLDSIGFDLLRFSLKTAERKVVIASLREREREEDLV